MVGHQYLFPDNQKQGQKQKLFKTSSLLSYLCPANSNRTFPAPVFMSGSCLTLWDQQGLKYSSLGIGKALKCRFRTLTGTKPEQPGLPWKDVGRVTCYLPEQCPAAWQSLGLSCRVTVNYNSNQQEFKVWSTKINLDAKWLLSYFTRVCLGGSNERVSDILH